MLLLVYIYKTHIKVIFKNKIFPFLYIDNNCNTFNCYGTIQTNFQQNVFNLNLTQFNNN